MRQNTKSKYLSHFFVYSSKSKILLIHFSRSSGKTSNELHLIASCLVNEPFGRSKISRNHYKSEPQTQVRTTLIIASVFFSIVGFSTSWHSTLPGSTKTPAFILITPVSLIDYIVFLRVNSKTRVNNNL